MELLNTLFKLQLKIELLAEKIMRLESSRLNCTASIGLIGKSTDDLTAAKLAKVQELRKRCECNCRVFLECKQELAEIIDRNID